MPADHVTIGIINFNGMGVLPATLEAVRALQYPAFDVLVVDNHSSDGSREWLQANHPQIACHVMPANLGAPAARNAVLARATGEHVLIMDNDIIAAPDMVARLMQSLHDVPAAGLAHPELHDDLDPWVHRYNGGWIHFLCALITREKPDPGQLRPPVEVFDAVSGAVLLVRKPLALEIGGFDGDFFFNWDDGDFTSRMTLAGHPCLNVPRALAGHRGKPRGTSKVFYQVRNRWYFILKLYSWRTLILTAPMLLLFEVLQALFLLKKGALTEYVRANLAVVGHLRAILAKRRAFQRLKRTRDRDWLRAGQMFVPPQLSRPGGIMERLQAAFFGVCNAYWRSVCRLC
jgi:GT2 family glycosyltransferase